MDAVFVGPYIISQVVAVAYMFAAWRWPRAMRFLTGIGFLIAGAYNFWVASTWPQLYVESFGPHAIAPYREFIWPLRSADVSQS